MEIKSAKGEGLDSLVKTLAEFGKSIKTRPKVKAACLVKDHPVLADLVAADEKTISVYEKKVEAINDQMEQIQKEVEEIGKVFWVKLEDYLFDQGLWPEGKARTDKVYIENRDGVIYIEAPKAADGPDKAQD